MLDIFITQETERVIRSVDKNRTMLIIGSDANRFNVNTISYYDSLEKAKMEYGDSDLTKAFEVAQEIGAPHVFLLNMKNQIDYVDLIDVLKQYDFAYIVPINIYISDYFLDAGKNNKRTYYAVDYMNRASYHNNSTIIFTDQHASLYEDIDTFLEDMKVKVDEIYDSVPLHAKSNNIAFVANNLERYPMSNVVLASALCSSEPGIYPSIKKTRAVFDIDSFDIDNYEIIYFKNNVSLEVTIENLVNFNKEAMLLKSIFVDRIVKYILRTLDMSELHGKLYRAYHKVQAQRMLENYFEAIKGRMIREYTIDSIEFIHEAAGVGYMECTVSIWVNSTVGPYTLKLGGGSNIGN